MTELSDQEVMEQRNDLEIIKRPWLWPHAVLPLKRVVDGQLQLSVVRIGSRREGTVKVSYGANMFSLTGRETWVDVRPEDLVRDGWEVD